MAFRANSMYNNPAFAAAAANIAQAFAPPSGADASGFASAKAKMAEEGRLAEAFRVITDPNSTNAMRDRFGIGSGRFNPASSFYSVDAAQATARRNADVAAATSRGNNAADNQRAIMQSMLTPVGQGETRFNPPAIAAQYGVDPQQSGMVKLDQGTEVQMPDGRRLAGAPKPLTRSEYEAEVLRTLPINQQQAVAFGSTPLQEVRTPEGVRFSTGPEALGREPAPSATTAAKVTNGTAVLPDGVSVPAVQRPGEDGWRHAQTGEMLPQGTKVYEMAKPEVTGSEAGVTKTTAGRIERSQLDLAQARQTATSLLKMVQETPLSQGLIGSLRGTFQDFVQTGGEFGQFFGGRVDDAQKQLADLISSGAADPEVAGIFNDRLPAIQMMQNLLTFQYAKTQTGERLSNEMLKQTSKALGFDGLFANQRSTEARIQQVIEQVDAQMAILNRARSQGTGNAVAPGSTQRRKVDFDANGNLVEVQ